jgi:hypothetical protein
VLERSILGCLPALKHSSKRRAHELYFEGGYRIYSRARHQQASGATQQVQKGCSVGADTRTMGCCCSRKDEDDYQKLIDDGSGPSSLHSPARNSAVTTHSRFAEVAETWSKDIEDIFNRLPTDLPIATDIPRLAKKTSLVRACAYLLGTFPVCLRVFLPRNTDETNCVALRAPK